MKIRGTEITAAQIEAMRSSMSESFRASDVIAAAKAAGVADDEVAMRAADNFIQRERKAQRIRLIASGPYWQVV